ncbi:DUF349 domain-containing protein [Cocleimonas sp. KMM 6892]|uniref:DUF349 domain-containing protein n=1 Tax=unclassified Cocleimonas TaxID=2639732 RepID=UPI002DBFA8F1|nr:MULTISPECIES: DUF349 domain-containing protein [unclassified Cocleimonas]MEB8433218.1 DUF349 domain-containing protein [Cocleimonas sp. KMM 6892]MEC4715801.1 DUF349 domain-containing protein [Cocleimonas sp. KMM 6895]MEC4745262.1 DUF349 domain-containing protein [Cocleimonas sp. KMM 6896]
MLADLFRPAWKSKSVEKRLKAIAAFDSNNKEHQEKLVQLATNDVDVNVCIAAIQQLKSAPALHEISLQHGNDKKTQTVCSAAAKRLDDLMGESASLNPQEFDDMLKRYPELSVRVAAHAETPEVREQAIQGLPSQQLIEVLSATAFTDSRQQIAKMLTGIETLESARKIIRGKDKNAERIIKTKIDECRELERQQTEKLETVNELIEEVEYLSSRDDWLPEFMPRCVAHCKRWDNLDFEISSESKQRYQAARNILDAQYKDRLTVKVTQESQQEIVDELKSLLENVADRDLETSIELLAETKEKHEDMRFNWDSLALISSPDFGLLNDYQQMIAALKSAIQLVEQVVPLFSQGSTQENADSEKDETEVKHAQLQKPVRALSSALNKLNWPSTYGVLQLETELQEQLAEWTAAKKDAAESYERQLTLVHKNISSIFHFAKIGNLTRAKQMCVRVEKALDNFTGKDAAALKTRYEEAFETLGDMGDWKSFATEPKYVELCEKMEQLIGSKTHPDKLFNEMKALQQQWKELGNSDISEQYWPRFKEASDKVYQPCEVFFNERRELRKNNLAQRQKHVEEMRELAEQSKPENNPDYKAVEASVRSISSHYTNIKDVEHKAGQKQWEQFSTFKDQVYDNLNIEYDANIALKHELIKQAAALAEEDAKEENLTALKTLQHRWKQIGVTKRKDDQKAWKEFKKQGDQVFGKIQEVRQGQRAETDEQLNAYRDIIKSIQTLAKTATELSEADHQFTELQASYVELPDLPEQLPEKLTEGIQRDYQNACSQFDECHDRIINNIRKGQLEALRRKAELCTQLEALYASAEEKTPDAKLLKDIENQWDSITLDDSDFTKRIEARRKSAATQTDRSEVTAERRLMCIKLEIAKGAETPAEDKSERMKFQLEQMNESGLGLQALNNAEQLKSLELDWLCMPGAEPQQQLALDKRFWRAFESK